jgi:hypothetical protein
MLSGLFFVHLLSKITAIEMTLKTTVRTLLLFALCLASCSRQAQPLPGEECVLRLQAPVQTTLTKTWLDASSGSSVAPVYWSAGDRVVVNGVVSSPLEAAPGQKLASASFFLMNVKTPYTVIYPDTAYAGKGENGSLLLDIPATQQWKDGSFCEGSALMYGYSEAEEAPVQMQNLCGAIAFTLKDQGGIKVKSMSLTSLTEGKPIAGHFSLNPGESLLLAPVGGNSSRIDMELPEGGITLTSSGTSFFFSIPAGEYPDGFLIRLDDENKHILRRWWLRPSEGAPAGVTLGAGKLVVFAACDYVPDAREICTAEDWEEFADAYNAGGNGWKAEWLGKDGTVKIGADFTAENLTRITTLADVLDGCGHTVTITAGTTPLVKTLTGTVRNLTIAGTNTPSDSSTDGASIFVTNLNGGTIQNCCNKATITLTNHARAIIAGPFVRTFTAGLVEGCVNEADFTLGCSIADANRYFLTGGIVGLVKDLTGVALVKNCTNKGKFTLTAITTTTAAKTPLQAAYGGIVGSVIGGTADKYLRVEGCVNEGDISVDFSPVPSTTVVAVTGAGGIIGTAMLYNGGLTFKWYSTGTAQVTSQEGVYFEMSGCVSKGNVHNGLCSKVAHGDPNMDFAAGLIGIANGLKDSPALIENCTVENINIEAIPNSYYQRSGFCMVSAGLAGFAGNASFKGCTVSGSKIGSLKRQSYAAAGGIGMAPITFTLQDCRIYADLFQIRSHITSGGVANPCTDRHFAMGFSLSTKKGPSGASGTGLGGMRNTLVNPEGSSVTGCSFGGSITTNPTLVEYSAQSGFSTVEKTDITAANYAKYIACESFTDDFYNRGVAAMVTISGNQYWNGQ